MANESTENKGTQNGTQQGSAEDRGASDDRLFQKFKELIQVELPKVVKAEVGGKIDKVNGEIARLRRRVRRQDEEDDQVDQEDETEAGPARRGKKPAAMSIEDIEALVTARVEVTKIKEQLSEEQVTAAEELARGRSASEQAVIYKAIALGGAGKGDGRSAGRGAQNDNRGPGAPRTGSRGEPPPEPGDGPTTPRTKDEYLKLKPEDRRKLEQDPNFDPDDLPAR